MQIIPNRRKDRILVRVNPSDGDRHVMTLHGHFDGRATQMRSPDFVQIDEVPYLVSVPVPLGKTKAMHARTLRGKFKGMTGTIKWTRGEAS